MSKNILKIIVVIVLICIVGGIAFYAINNGNSNNEINPDNNLNENIDNPNVEDNENNVVDNQTEENNQNNVVDNPVEENNENNVVDNQPQENNTAENKKTLVVYFSAQNHTEEVANKIANNLNADTFEIVPKEEYAAADLSWTNSESRVSKEHDDESLRNVELDNTTVDNWDSYDTVLIGYPIWWGIAAWPTNTFVKANDFTGKTVIPFCTSSSSGLGESGNLLAQDAGTGTWLEGHRFSSNPSDSDIKNWTDSLNK